MSRSLLRAALFTSIPSLFLATAVFAQAPAGAPAPAPAPAPVTIEAIALPPIPPNSLANRPRVDMTVQQAVALALEKNFNVQLQKYSLQNTEESLYSARSRYFPAFTVSSSGPTFTERKSTSSSGTSSISRTTSWSTSGQLTQNLATGGTVTATVTPFNRSGNPSSYGTGLNFSFNHPLLRGFGRRITQNALRNSELSLLTAKNNYRALIMDTILSVENAYTSLIQARDNLEIRRGQEAISQRQYDEALVRRQAGMQTEIQLNQAKQSLLSNVNSRIEQERSVKSAEDSLRNLLGPSDFNIEIVPTSIADVNFPLPTVEAAYALTLKNSTDYANRLISINQQEVALAITRDALKPQLSLSSSIGTTGSDPVLSDSWTSTSHRDNYSWSVGLSLSVNISKYSERSALRSALTSMASTRLGLTQTEQSIRIQVINAVRSIETAQRSLAITQISVLLARQNYAANEQQARVGSLTQLALIQSQQTLDSAEVSLTQSKTSLRQAITALERLEGTTLDRYGIQLPKMDLPPDDTAKKTYFDRLLDGF